MIQELHKSVQQNNKFKCFPYTYRTWLFCTQGWYSITLIASWIWADPRSFTVRRESEVGNFRRTSIFRFIRRSLSSPSYSSLKFVFLLVFAFFFTYLIKPFIYSHLWLCAVSLRGSKASTLQHVQFLIQFLLNSLDFLLQSYLCYLS